VKIKGATIAAIIGVGFVFFCPLSAIRAGPWRLFLGISSRNAGGRREVMKCERCLSLCGEIAEYRVRTDVMDIKVCWRCADEARAIGLAVAPLNEVMVRGGTDPKVAA
jgi:hypothetical protein